MKRMLLLVPLVVLALLVSACNGDDDSGSESDAASDATGDTEAFCEGLAALGEDVDPEVEPVPADVPADEQMAAILDGLVIDKADAVVALSDVAPEEIANEWANLADIFQELESNGLQGLLTIDNELEQLEADRDTLDSWIRGNCDLEGLDVLEGDG